VLASEHSMRDNFDEQTSNVGASDDVNPAPAGGRVSEDKFSLLEEEEQQQEGATNGIVSEEEREED